MTHINNMEFDLVISGNVYFDTLIISDEIKINENINDFEKVNSVGGVFNLLPGINPKLKCLLSFSASYDNSFDKFLKENFSVDCRRLK